MAGATGVPLAPGNRIDILNNGDEFYPAMLDEIAHAQASITIEAYIYWAGEIGMRVRARARGSRTGGCPREDPARRGRVGAHRRRDPESARRRRLPARVVQPDALVHDRPLQPPHPPQVARRRRPDRLHRRCRHRRPLAGARAGRRALARSSRSASKGRAVTPLQTGFAQNWLQTTGELISGPLYYPPLERSGAPGCSDDHELTGDRRLDGAHHVLPVDRLRAPVDLHRQPVLRARRGGDRCADRGEAAWRRRPHHRVRASATTTGWRAATACASSAACSGPASRSSSTTARCCTRRRWSSMRVWATVGTTNFDNRSFAHNEENNVCVYDRDVGARSARHVPRRCAPLRARPPRHVAAPWCLGTGAGSGGGAAAGADVRRWRNPDAIALLLPSPGSGRPACVQGVQPVESVCWLPCVDGGVAGDGGGWSLAGAADRLPIRIE